jgi:CubicO group peptidase (beta-lactamase class C family)
VKSSLLLPFLLLPLTVHADAIDDAVNREMKRFNIPGLSLGIFRDGKLVRKQAYGLADLELSAPAQADDLYEIGSMTKQFTAFLTLMLVEEGKIGLDDPISKYIPEAPASWSKVTIRHMLNQNSGLPEYVTIPGIGLMDDFDRKKWMEGVTPLPLDFEPGTTWAYSNTNFALLGWAIEKVAGKPYTDVLTERVLKPLGMEHTRFENVNDVIPRRSHGYLPQPGAPMLRVEGMKGTSVQSDGTLLSTVDDLGKWDAALLERKLLKPESYRLLWSPGKLNSGRTRPYGMGWMLNPPGTKPAVYHPGASVGFGACITRYESPKITVVVLTNLYSSAPEVITRRVAEAYEPSLIPEIPKEKTDPNPDRTKRIRETLEKLGAGMPDMASLEPEFSAPLQTARARMFPQYRDFTKLEKFDYAGETKEGSDTMVVYRLKNDRRSLTAYVLWTKDNKLAQLYLRADPAV